MVVSDNRQDTGRFFGEIRSDIMNQLVLEGIYKQNRMYDYQATCFQPMETGNPASTFSNVSIHELIKYTRAGTLLHLQPFTHFAYILHWFSITFLTTHANGFAPIEEENLEEEVQLVPCDKEYWIYFHANKKHAHPNFDSRFSSSCAPSSQILATEHVPYTNLLLLVINKSCMKYESSSYPKTKEIQYDLPYECHVENNYLGRNPISNCIKEEFWNVSVILKRK